MSNFSCTRCYQLDKHGQIERFLCSRYGWRAGFAPCLCRSGCHREPSLYARGYAWEAA